MELLITLPYILSLLFLFLFSLGQLHLTWLYLKSKKQKKNNELEVKDFEPYVTLQLPVYNEKYVIERLIDAVSKLDYPKDKLEIQVLDDSTDETTGLAKQKIEWLQSQGLDIQLIRRPERKDFKAGALDYGLQIAKLTFSEKPFFILPMKILVWCKPVGVISTKIIHYSHNYRPSDWMRILV